MSGDDITTNIFYSTAASSSNAFVVYGGTADVSGNLYYNTNGQTTNTAGVDTDPITGNPEFANASAEDFTLGSTSSASLIGFTGIDQSLMGLNPSVTHWD
jgi:hypothetical protein